MIFKAVQQLISKRASLESQYTGGAAGSDCGFRPVRDICGLVVDADEDAAAEELL